MAENESNYHYVLSINENSQSPLPLRITGHIFPCACRYPLLNHQTHPWFFDCSYLMEVLSPPSSGPHRYALAALVLRGTRVAILRLRGQDYEDEFVSMASQNYEEVMERSMMEDARMVPAHENSVRAVMGGKMDWEGADEDCCVICMEEFGKGSQVARLPCLHYFHGECLQRWLHTSHYCPVCRYEMPTC